MNNRELQEFQVSPQQCQEVVETIILKFIKFFPNKKLCGLVEMFTKIMDVKHNMNRERMESHEKRHMLQNESVDQGNGDLKADGGKKQEKEITISVQQCQILITDIMQKFSQFYPDAKQQKILNMLPSILNMSKNLETERQELSRKWKIYVNQKKDFDEKYKQLLDNKIRFDDRDLIKRVVHQRDEKNSQLVHMTEKYDELLQLHKKYKLETEGEIKRLKQQLQRMKRQNERLSKQLEQEKKKVLELSKNNELIAFLKNQISVHKQMVMRAFYSFRQQWTNKFVEITQRCSMTIWQMRKDYQAQISYLDDKAKKSSEQQDKYRNKFVKAVYYLEKQSNFQRKFVGEDQEEYFEKYDKIKQHEKENLQIDSIFVKTKDLKIDEFIKNQRDILKNIKSRLGK